MKGKRVSKLLTTMLLVLAFLVMDLSYAMPRKASAALSAKELSKYYLSATTKTLNLGSKDNGTYNFNINSSAKQKGSKYSWYVKEDKGNPAAVTVKKSNGIVTAKETGTAYVRVKITLPNGEIVRPEAKVTVVNYITEVDISNLPENNTMTAGQIYDFNRTILNTQGGKGMEATGITRWEIADDTAGVENATTSGIVYPIRAGEFKIRAVSFGSSAKYDEWLKDKDANKNNITAASNWYTITVNAPAGYVEAADFGVMNFSQVKGYNVGFNLIGLKASNIKDVEINLYKDEQLLATATTNQLIKQYPDAVTLSAPFDVFGEFDYEADGSWNYSGWKGAISDIPTKAEIKVTFKNDIEKTVINTNLTGDTSIFTKGDVTAADFGVMDFSGVKGFNVGFNLIDALASDVEKVEINLYNKDTVLATATTDLLLKLYPDSTSLSAPFDVFGGFDYERDGNWTYSGWNGAGLIPDKAEIKVLFKNGVEKIVTNTNLTGDTSMFTKGNVEAADFGVMNISGVVGYNVGFNLIDAKASDVDNVVIRLYKDEVVLGEVVTNELLTQYPDAVTLSAPLDVVGTFDYVADKSWTYGGWKGEASDIPNKAEIIVTFKNSMVKTVVNTNLTGDTSIFNKNAVIGNLGLIYTMEVNLVDAKASDVKSIEVTMFNEAGDLATAVSKNVLTKNPEAVKFNVPFDILGIYDYEVDQDWTYSGWNGDYTNTPTGARIKITYKDGMVRTSTTQAN